MDGMFYMNGTTSMPMSVLRYVVDKVKEKTNNTAICYIQHGLIPFRLTVSLREC